MTARRSFGSFGSFGLVGLVGVLALLRSGSVAADPAGGPELSSLFSHRAPIEVDAPDERLARLPLPGEVLSRCRPDLSDLRIVDAAGREVPWAVESGPAAELPTVARQSVTPEILGADREEVRPENAPPRRLETFRLAVPGGTPETGRWDLELRTDAASFVRRIDVRAGPEGGDVPLVEDGSVFRLRDPLRERLRIPLPPLPPEARTLIVTLEGEDEPWLAPRFLLETGRRIPARGRLEVALEEIARTSEDGRTTVELRRPRGLVPDTLRVETGTETFRRQVEVWDEGSGAVGAIGAGEIWRVRAAARVEELSVPVAAPRGDRLRVVVVDRDSPPLLDLRIVAVLREPALLFALPPRDDAPDGHLLFGGGRAFAPDYDLAALRPERLPLRGAEAERARPFVDPAVLAPARLGEITENPHYDPDPALAFAMRPGAEVDPAGWSHRRELRVEGSSEGLVRWTLGPEDLAVLRQDLADLRLVDGDGRQWAWIAEDAATEVALPLDAEQQDGEPGETRLALRLPASPAVLDRLVVDSPAPFFDRPFELWGTPPDGEPLRLASGRLERRPGDPRPVRIEIPRRPLEALELRIDDGQDAPLALGRVVGHFPVPIVYLPAPAGAYRALLGRPDAEAPRYELERVRPLVLSVASAPVEAGPLVLNPEFRRRTRWASDAGRQKILLWAALLVAVGVLAGLTLRLARDEAPGDDG